MKRVVSVSIGSSSRNHRIETELLGETFLIERIGTDGDLKRAIEIVRELDGQVDAIGLGGIDLYIYSGGRRYRFRDAYRIARAAEKTPVVDGSGLKNSLERWAVNYIDKQTDIKLKGKRVLVVVAVDRFGMAEALTELGCQMLFGDLIFGLGIPIGLHSPLALERLASVLGPVVVRLPFKLLYPTGSKQESMSPRYERFFDWAEVIAGDFHYIRRYMPRRLDAKTILTNTVTPENVEEIKSRGAATLITTTPSFGGRSFGTNVLEAVLVALSDKPAGEIDYLELIERLEFKPRIERFEPQTTVSGDRRPVFVGS
ncbi:MAG: quinate 5-dehydrogenase [Firmicutes bacterium]|jgi:hypothetical protein|nr:quinate 5-dehydrogenase [Bacillota bacterium]